MKQLRAQLARWRDSVSGIVLYQTFVPITPNDASQFSQVLRQNDQTLGEFINLAFRLSMGIAAMLAVGVILYAGFRYMTSVTPSTKEGAKKHLRDAIIGLLLLISIVLILDYINPNILCLDFTLPDPNAEPGTNQDLPCPRP